MYAVVINNRNKITASHIVYEYVHKPIKFVRADFLYSYYYNNV